jgi:transglycosylase-like protein
LELTVLVPELEEILTVLLTALVLFLPVTQNYDARWETVRPYNAKLERIAVCETRWNGHARWFLNSGNGYYGGLQFDLSTWKSVGGRGYPHHNSKLEQKYRAVRLIKQRGYRPWPRCGSA